MAIVWAGPTVQTVTADNLADPEPVIPPNFCSKITIVEAGGLGTTAFLVRAPYDNSDPVLVGAGGSWVWTGKFNPGVTACWLETVAGSVQFTVVCE